MSNTEWEAAEQAVMEAMTEHGPDGHIDGYEIITRAAVNAYLAAQTTEWGTITVDNPTGVNITTEQRAFEDTAAWNSTRRVRLEGGARDVVVKRTVTPWVEVRS